MDNAEKIERHTEQLSDLRADYRTLEASYKNIARELGSVTDKVLSNQKLLHGALIASGILLTLFTAFAPILKPLVLEAIK